MKRRQEMLSLRIHLGQWSKRNATTRWQPMQCVKTRKAKLILDPRLATNPLNPLLCKVYVVGAATIVLVVSGSEA